MKILVISHYQNDGTPTASFIHDQVKQFRALGHEVTVLVPVAYGKPDYFNKRVGKSLIKTNIDGVEHFFFKYLSISKYGKDTINDHNAIKTIKKRLLNKIIEFNPDVIHAHTLGLDSKIALWIKSFINKPVVVTIHGSDLTKPFNNGEQHKIKQWCSGIDAIVCVGSKLKEKLLLCNIETETLVINNGFNIENVFTKVKKKNSFIQVCNLISSKNIDITIQAFSKIRESYPDATLKIIGKGPEEKKLKELCSKLDLKDSVVFLGQLNNEEVLLNMAESEFFIMVSSPEGFGIVYLEAMASSCLTIGTENEGISDLIISGNNGILLPARDVKSIVDTAIYYIKQSEERHKITEKGRNVALNNSWNENAIKYIRLFERIIRNYDK